MDDIYAEDCEEVSVVGFEAPSSPESSYNRGFCGPEGEPRDPPLVPPHLQHTLLSFPATKDSGTLPSPQNVILNHMYVENRDNPHIVAALGLTHRFRAKFVTVVLYKPIQTRRY